MNDSVWNVLNTVVNRNLEQIRNRAYTNIKDSQNENARRYNLQRKNEYKTTHEYKIDYVEIRNVETMLSINKKLPKFEEPYVVKKVLGYDRYVVIDIEGFQLKQRPYTGALVPDRPYIYIYYLYLYLLLIFAYLCNFL